MLFKDLFVPLHCEYTLISSLKEDMDFPKINFIDLFAGIGGIRLGLELAAKEMGIETQCVFTSEIKDHAICHPKTEPSYRRDKWRHNQD